MKKRRFSVYPLCLILLWMIIAHFVMTRLEGWDSMGNPFNGGQNLQEKESEREEEGRLNNEVRSLLKK